MADHESDVSKALAAFGAPPLKYRSFAHAEIQTPAVTPPAPAAPSANAAPPAPAPAAGATPIAQVVPPPMAWPASLGPVAARAMPPAVAPERHGPVPVDAGVVPEAHAMAYAPSPRDAEAGDIALPDLFRLLLSAPVRHA